MQFDLKERQRRIFRILTICLCMLLIFRATDFALSEIADRKAYEDAEIISAEQWDVVYGKIIANEQLTDEDYDIILSQTGLGRCAVERLGKEGKSKKTAEYYEYYTSDKEFECVREGVFACHEQILSTDGEPTANPVFADLQNGDIILTLSIHSLGWRHGHAAIVTDAENGLTVEAVMFGQKSKLSSVSDWSTYPLVAVLRAKDTNSEIRDEIARFAADNLVGLDYSLLAGIIGGRDTQNIPVSTQCAHLVWYAYKAYGIDIDYDGGRVVTPYDILHSEKLELVQIYGNIKEL